MLAFISQHNRVEIIRVPQIRHGAVRDIDHGVHIVFAVRQHLFDDADYLIGNAINTNALANGVLAREYFLLNVGADYRNSHVREILLIIKECPFAHIDMAALLITRISAANIVDRAASSPRHTSLLVYLWRRALQKWNFRTEVI